VRACGHSLLCGTRGNVVLCILFENLCPSWCRLAAGAMPVGFLNRLLFFPPKEDTYSVSSWPGELCMLRGVVCRALPCLRKNEDGELAQKEAPFVLIFCHGNSADLGLCNYLEELRDGLQVHVIGVEYPGFGLSKAGSGFACESTVDDVVRTVYKCLMEDLQWEARRILLMGRSIGCGPVLRLASEQPPGVRGRVRDSSKSPYFAFCTIPCCF
jgi:pimeloyl-ACP methyl ester carboxylesterase